MAIIVFSEDGGLFGSSLEVSGVGVGGVSICFGGEVRAGLGAGATGNTGGGTGVDDGGGVGAGEVAGAEAAVGSAVIGVGAETGACLGGVSV